MKKICLFILILFLVPFTVMAEMKPMSDTQMEAVTGQAGVTLAPIDFSLDLNVKNLAYTDPTDVRIPRDITGGVFNLNTRQVFVLNLLNKLKEARAQTSGAVAIQGIELILYAYPRMVKSADGTIGPIPSGTNVYKEYIASSSAEGSPLALGDAFNLRHRSQLIISPN